MYIIHFFNDLCYNSLNGDNIMKKNILSFFLGMVTMFIILLGISACNQIKNNSYPGLTLFEKEAGTITAKQVKIFQTLGPDIALAHTTNIPNAIFDPNQILVLILGDENTHFYDDKKINIPKNKILRQVGTYEYQTNNGNYKTVPAVVIK